MSSAPSPRILLIDAYDSFSSNLSSLIATSTSTPCTVHTIHIDSPFSTLPPLLPFLASFDALVIGPGPGHPAKPTDVGIVADIWHLADQHLLPVFGVCLGLQSLCLAFGGDVEHMETVKHGLISRIEHSGKGLFEGVGTIDAVRYHSLYAKLRQGGDIEPLAWAHDENRKVLMAAKHRTKPFYAVQYHPESICTNCAGREVVENFWKLACKWNVKRGRKIAELPEDWKITPQEKSLLERQVEWERSLGLEETNVRKREVRTKTLMTCGLEASQICEMLGVESADEFVLLDSAAAPGRWSIIAVLTPGVTQLITYTVGDPHATVSHMGSRKSSSHTKLPLKDYEGSIWQFLAKYMHSRTATNGLPESPFWGGLVGYLNYEAGVAALGIPVSRGDRMPNALDVNLAFAERSIVMDGETGRVYIQTLLDDIADCGWLEITKQQVQLVADMAVTPSGTPPPHTPDYGPSLFSIPPKMDPEIYRPDKETYIRNIHAAQSHLAVGDSYELCLTASTTILQPRCTTPSAWSIYTSLRSRNPAPYAAFLRLAGVTLLSSSPERFLSWTREGVCQLRPIKGTVRKTPDMTRENAERLLSTPKERAENLMIVDLIRHDLHRLAEDSVSVRKLMVVEEYAHVFQLVSVIEGTLLEGRTTGFDVLAGSLPPGSMTGAPKKRSVELLKAMEGAERGVYSGVVGYWSVCGAGDWSVIIRSAVRDDREFGRGRSGKVCDVWRIGAGGAITALSVPGDEWEEMETKLDSTLRAFVG